MIEKTHKRQRKPEKRPDEILDAALSVFSEKGFADTRMDDVAHRARLSKGALYLYFKSKEQLFEALVRRFAETFAHVIAARITDLGTRDPVAAVRTAITFIFAAISDPAISAAPRLVLSEAQRFPAIAALYRREVIEVGKAAIQSVLKEGQRQGLFHPIDPDTALRENPMGETTADQLPDCILRALGVPTPEAAP